MIFLNKLVLNLAGPPRRKTVNGREYLIAPLVLIVPGVLSGSKGALLYEPDEVARSADDWEGVPITINHPYHPDTGVSLSATEPGVLDRQGVGVVRRSRMVGGKLVADGWFDVQRLSAVNARVLRDIQAGYPVEVSTGLFTRNVASPGYDRRTGRSYDYIARDYRPDHLAVLTDQPGACSLRDGCGANVANSVRPRRRCPKHARCECASCSTNEVPTVTDEELDELLDNMSDDESDDELDVLYNALGDEDDEDEGNDQYRVLGPASLNPDLLLPLPGSRLVANEDADDQSSAALWFDGSGIVGRSDHDDVMRENRHRLGLRGDDPLGLPEDYARDDMSEARPVANAGSVYIGDALPDPSGIRSVR